MINRPQRIAHRGDGKTAPENTFDSVKAAVEFGCEGVEIDVRLTKDHKIVLMHDEEILRMICNGNCSGESRKLRQMDWSDVSELLIPYENHLLPDFPKEGYQFEQILFERVNKRMLGQDLNFPYRKSKKFTNPVLLEEIILWLQKTHPNIFLEVECKDHGMAPFLDDLLKRTHSYNQVILMSGDPSVIEEHYEYFKVKNPLQPVRTGANIRTLDNHWKRKLVDMDFYEVGLNVEHISEDTVNYLHQKGVKVFSNLGDYPIWWEKMHTLQIDGFKTNYIRDYTYWMENQDNL